MQLSEVATAFGDTRRATQLYELLCRYGDRLIIFGHNGVCVGAASHSEEPVEGVVGVGGGVTAVHRSEHAASCSVPGQLGGHQPDRYVGAGCELGTGWPKTSA